MFCAIQHHASVGRGEEIGTLGEQPLGAGELDTRGIERTGVGSDTVDEQHVAGRVDRLRSLLRQLAYPGRVERRHIQRRVINLGYEKPPPSAEIAAIRTPAFLPTQGTVATTVAVPPVSATCRIAPSIDGNRITPLAQVAPPRWPENSFASASTVAGPLLRAMRFNLVLAKNPID